MSLYQAHEPDLTELGKRAEMAMRFSFISDVWAESERHPPSTCVCYLLGAFFNHKTFDACDNYGYCGCAGCREVRRAWIPQHTAGTQP
jgi:hypothetical protein